MGSHPALQQREPAATSYGPAVEFHRRSGHRWLAEGAGTKLPRIKAATREQRYNSLLGAGS